MLTPLDIIYLIFALVTLYFAVLFLLLYYEHRKLPKEKLNLSRLPLVSILIPAFNEEKTIANTIKSVKRLDYPKRLLDIIVIDDGSTDNTGKIASTFGGIKLVRKKNEGRKAYAVNHGLKFAKGEIVGCVDADSYPKPDSLMRAIGFFKDPKVAAVTSSIFVHHPRNLIERLQQIEYILIVWSRKLLEIVDGIYVTPGALSLYKKNILKKVGAFDPSNMTEDIEIAWRLLYHGYTIKMALDSVVYTGTPQTFTSWWNQRVRWCVGGIQTTIKYIGVFMKKDFKSLGMFVLPFFTFSYFFSVVGLGVFAYVVGKNLYNILYYIIYAFILGVDAIGPGVVEQFLLPSIFSVFGTIIFSLSILWVIISYRKTKRNIGGIGGLFDLVIYLTLYITLFPIIVIQATIKFLRNDYKWR